MCVCTRPTYTPVWPHQHHHQDAFAPVALATLQRLVARLPSVGSDLDALRALLGCARLLCRVFYSLNGPGLTPVRGGGTQA